MNFADRNGPTEIKYDSCIGCKHLRVGSYSNQEFTGVCVPPALDFVPQEMPVSVLHFKTPDWCPVLRMARNRLKIQEIEEERIKKNFGLKWIRSL